MSAQPTSVTGLVARRLLQLPFIVLAVYTLTFILAWSVPGNPLENPEGRRPPAEIVEAMKKQYKLDDPVAFYFDYLGKASGVSWLLGTHDRPFDLGPSLKQPDWNVNEILATGLPVSMTLGLSAMLIAVSIGIVELVLLLHRLDDLRGRPPALGVLERVARDAPREDEGERVDREHDERQLQQAPQHESGHARRLRAHRSDSSGGAAGTTPSRRSSEEMSCSRRGCPVIPPSRDGSYMYTVT